MADEADDAPRLLAFFSMVDARKRLHRDVMEQIARDHRGVLEAAVPAASDVERMGVHRNVVAQFAPRGRAARAYEDLWREVEGRLAPSP